MIDDIMARQHSDPGVTQTGVTQTAATAQHDAEQHTGSDAADTHVSAGTGNGSDTEAPAYKAESVVSTPSGQSESGTENSDEEDGSIPLTAVDEIGKATAQDVREALHQVIDPELGIDVIDLGLVYGIEIDELGRAIITMTLTTPACPLTELIEDECASTLAGLVQEFRIDWTWQPQWGIDKITPEGRDQLAAIGFNLNNMPRY